MITEGLVAFADSGAEAVLRGAPLERIALLGVPRDPVEHRAQYLAGVEPLGVQRLVDKQLHHPQLVDRVTGNPLKEDLSTLVQVLGRGRLDCQPPLERLEAGERIAGEQQPLGTLRPETMSPQRGRRRAPYTCRRVADLRIGG